MGTATGHPFVKGGYSDTKMHQLLVSQSFLLKLILVFMMCIELKSSSTSFAVTTSGQQQNEGTVTLDQLLSTVVAGIKITLLGLTEGTVL